ncbi:hypothetical protein N7519_006919 [Penicillium mononematosum]|uniref:uncharacterized protein n=1 Tax=Penicillium mononematosum TaxID=268346 RepID=UPI002547E7DB|nr:uncharacterized protein N7519_006919 [Penicillium mononematosum]KAJ6185618.1 hypothetical protein N7519_006919 [Penicillium mononematosum]
MFTRDKKQNKGFLPKKVSSFLSAKITMSSNNPPRAPWRELLDFQLRQTPGYEFTIATVEQSEEGKYFPRARICGFRGFFPDVELHPNGENDMQEQVINGGNPPSFESDLFTFTTDARMEKLSHLQSSEHEIEALFWLKEVSSQWRVKGKAFAIGNPRGECDEGEREARAAIRRELRLKPGTNSASAGWTFEHAVTKYFANHSPVMRGSFRAPPPGSPKRGDLPDSGLNPSLAVTDLYDNVARENFRVVGICPREVEKLDLSDRDHLRRWRWTLESKGEDENISFQWLQTELNP